MLHNASSVCLRYVESPTDLATYSRCPRGVHWRAYSIIVKRPSSLRPGIYLLTPSAYSPQIERRSIDQRIRGAVFNVSTIVNMLFMLTLASSIGLLPRRRRFDRTCAGCHGTGKTQVIRKNVKGVLHVLATLLQSKL